VKVGDLVVKKRDPAKILGMVVRLFSIDNQSLHNDPLPMVEIMTNDGMHIWKRRKVRVASESR
jgi:ribulose 1,5-bisphosphate synthetase/thiazole synthase